MLRAVLGCFLASVACSPICPAGDCPDDAGFVDRGDGWDDPIGRGSIYAVSGISITSAGIGFDLDGRCSSGSCIDNRLSALAASLNDAIDTAHIQGNGRTLLEIAGDESSLTGDPRATLKSYEALDWIQPPFTDDDFRIGDPSCCMFFVSERSTFGSRDRARWRVPALVRDGVVRQAGVGELAFMLPLLFDAARLTSLKRPMFEISTAAEDPRKLSARIAGAIPAFELSLTPNEACRRQDPSCESTLLDDLVSRGLQPDLDLDGDGLETFRFDPSTGRIGECFEGCVEGCPAPLSIAPEDVDRPWTCALTDSVSDGYSVTLQVSATPAFILGVR